MTFEQIVARLSETFNDSVLISYDAAAIQPYITVTPASILEVCKFLFTDKSLYFDYLQCITGIDNGAQKGTMEVLYHMTSIPYGHQLVIRVELPRNQAGDPLPALPSVASIWRTADWHERETYDLLGIQFENHPDLRRILLPEDWEGYPLRKDYSTQEVYHGIRVRYEDRNNPDQEI